MAALPSREGSPEGKTIPLARVATGLTAELKAKWPHLADYEAFRIAAGDLDAVPEALKGQLAVSATDAEGSLRIATGVQIPGVLDDLYANDGALGVAWAGTVPTVRIWAPTAKSVALRLYPDATTASSTTHAMTRDDATGVWSVTGTAAWKNQFYLYDVEVFAPSTGQVEHNLVTDPYSLALATQLHSHPDRQPVRRQRSGRQAGPRYTKPGQRCAGRHLALRAPRP